MDQCQSQYSNIFFSFNQKGLPGAVGPVGSGGPNGEKVSSNLHIIACLNTVFILVFNMGM